MIDNIKVYHSPGRLVFRCLKSHSKDYLIQIELEEHWVKSNDIGRYLKVTYQMTTEEYYDLVVYESVGIKPPKCPYCGKKLRFKNLTYNYNYYKTCSSPECTFNAYSEANKASQINRVKNGTHQFLNNSGIREKINKNTSRRNKRIAELGVHPCQDIVNNINMQKGLIKKKGSPEDVLYYYIARTEDLSTFKLGVTKNIIERINISSFSNSKFLKYRIITSGLRENIAELEAEVKLKFMTKSEYFPIKMFKEVILFIKSIISKYEFKSLD